MWDTLKRVLIDPISSQNGRKRDAGYRQCSQTTSWSYDPFGFRKQYAGIPPSNIPRDGVFGTAPFRNGASATPEDCGCCWISWSLSALLGLSHLEPIALRPGMWCIRAS